MAADGLTGKFQGLKINDNQDINILLLGETGVGKSTFINAIANYLHFKSFKKAAKSEELLILIPSVITVTNEYFEQITITIGSDNNEYQEIGAAGTQDVKTYVFPIGEGKTRLRLIDSPGMGDPRGIEQDDINCENILTYLSQLKELHAICFLMKPTTTRKTILFEYCVKQILSRLEKSASKNIIFIFTNTRGTNYTPGDTLPCLKTIIDEIKTKPPHVDIPLKDNVFSLDNEAFRFLVAMRKNIKFNEDIQQRFIESWKNSAEQCWRLISYIVGDASHDPLKPHQLYNTTSINEARRIIVQLSQPLAEISQLIHDNLRILDKHRRNLKMDNQSLDELKKKLYVPVVHLEVTQLTQPVTVCTSAKCANIVQVGEVQKWHYGQRCHDPCYLTNVTKEIVGDVNLMHCAAMSGRTCHKCTCDFSVHMHVYYLTKTVNDKIADNVVLTNIRKKEEALAESRRLIEEIDRRKSELEQERDVIIKSTAQFAHFLQYNAISPFNDSYKAYIEYLIHREQSLGSNGDREVIYNLEQLVLKHEEIKAAFENSLNLTQQYGLNTVLNSSVTAQSVMNTIQQLYQLKHNGKKIKELIKKQKTSRNSEYDKNCEYIHPKSSDLSHTESKKDKKSKKTEEKVQGRSKKDTKKSEKSTDDERINKKVPYNKNYNPQYNQRARHYNHEQHNSQSSSDVGLSREPPPPYSGPLHTDSVYHNHPSTYYNKEGKPNVVVKVELSHSNKEQKVLPIIKQERNQNLYLEQVRTSYRGPSPSSYETLPQRSYQDSPQSVYNESPHAVYQGPPHSSYYGDSRTSYQDSSLYQGPYGGRYQGPPQGQYYGPRGHHHGPPQGQHYGPRSQHHGPPQGQHYEPHAQYHGPPQGQHYEPHGQYHGPPIYHGHVTERPYQGQQHGPPQPSLNRVSSVEEGRRQKYNNYSARGRGYNKRGGGNSKRSGSKPRYNKDKKSGNEKSTRSSSSSDSSSD